MIIDNVKVYTEEKTFVKGGIMLDGDKIQRVYAEEEKPQFGEKEVLDGEGAYAIPGLIDLHFHGCKGDDFCDGNEEAIERIAQYEASIGVTAIAPATMTLPVEELKQILSVAAKYEEIVQRKYGFKDWDSVLAAIGHGGLKEGQVVNRLAEEYGKDHKQELTDEIVLEKVAEAAKNKVHIAKSKSGIVVKGIDDVAVRFSRCCNPVPGDEIVGFVTRGRGLSIHRTDCINMIHLSEAERARLIPAEWETEVTEKSGGQYLAEIKMYANDQQGLLMEISRIFTEENVDVKSMNVRTSKKGTATIEMGFIVHGREELERIVKKLQQLSGIIDIERATG